MHQELTWKVQYKTFKRWMNEWMLNALSGCFIYWMTRSWVNNLKSLQAFTNKSNQLSWCKSPFLFNWQKNPLQLLLDSTDYNSKSKIARLSAPFLAPLHFNSWGNFPIRLILKTHEKNLFWPAHSRKNKQEFSLVFFHRFKIVLAPYPRSTQKKITVLCHFYCRS